MQFTFRFAHSRPRLAPPAFVSASDCSLHFLLNGLPAPDLPRISALRRISGFPRVRSFRSAGSAFPTSSGYRHSGRGRGWISRILLITAAPACSAPIPQLHRVVTPSGKPVSAFRPPLELLPEPRRQRSLKFLRTLHRPPRQRMSFRCPSNFASRQLAPTGESPNSTDLSSSCAAGNSMHGFGVSPDACAST